MSLHCPTSEEEVVIEKYSDQEGRLSVQNFLFSRRGPYAGTSVLDLSVEKFRPNIPESDLPCYASDEGARVANFLLPLQREDIPEIVYSHPLFHIRFFEALCLTVEEFGRDVDEIFPYLEELCLHRSFDLTMLYRYGLDPMLVARHLSQKSIYRLIPEEEFCSTVEVWIQEGFPSVFQVDPVNGRQYLAAGDFGSVHILHGSFRSGSGDLIRLVKKRTLGQLEVVKTIRHPGTGNLFAEFENFLTNTSDEIIKRGVREGVLPPFVYSLRANNSLSHALRSREIYKPYLHPREWINFSDLCVSLVNKEGANNMALIKSWMDSLRTLVVSGLNRLGVHPNDLRAPNILCNTPFAHWMRECVQEGEEVDFDDVPKTARVCTNVDAGLWDMNMPVAQSFLRASRS